MVFNLYKQKGETPLECLQRFIGNNPEYKKEKWTYAGRLDPMADGVLLACTGEDIKKKEEFSSLDKEYEFVSLFGFATDSYDVLGKILRVEKIENIEVLELQKLAEVYVGEREQKYPEYSSKVQKWNNPSANSGQEDGDWPTKKIRVYEMEFINLERLRPKELLGRLLMDISKVKGDFRQNEIMVLWKEILSKFQGDLFLTKWRAKVSSGTYIRSIVNDIGNSLGIGACALSITRTQVGDYKIEQSMK